MLVCNTELCSEMDYLRVCVLLNSLAEGDDSIELSFSRETRGSLELQDTYRRSMTLC